MQLSHEEEITCPYCKTVNEVTLYFDNLSEDNGKVFADCGVCKKTMVLQIAYVTKLKVGKIEYEEPCSTTFQEDRR